MSPKRSPLTGQHAQHNPHSTHSAPTSTVSLSQQQQHHHHSPSTPQHQWAGDDFDAELGQLSDMHPFSTTSGNRSDRSPLSPSKLTKLRLASDTNLYFNGMDGQQWPGNMYQSNGSVPMSNSTSTQPQTISPSDLQLTSTISSNFSTPEMSLLDGNSPFTPGTFSHQTSPDFHIDGTPFTDDLQYDESGVQPTQGMMFPELPANPHEYNFNTEPSPTVMKSASMSRNQSSSSPAKLPRNSLQGRAKITGGVSKPTKTKRRQKELPEIVPKRPGDQKEEKKIRNTIAARKSRAKKTREKEWLRQQYLFFRDWALTKGFPPDQVESPPENFDVEVEDPNVD